MQRFQSKIKLSNSADFSKMSTKENFKNWNNLDSGNWKLELKKAGSQAEKIVQKKKKYHKMTECNNFDIIGVCLSDYGLTGESIAIQIFSYLDFSSLTKGLSVCETWNQFLTKDRTLWLKMLAKTQPSL